MNERKISRMWFGITLHWTLHWRSEQISRNEFWNFQIINSLIPRIRNRADPRCVWRFRSLPGRRTEWEELKSWDQKLGIRDQRSKSSTYKQTHRRLEQFTMALRLWNELKTRNIRNFIILTTNYALRYTLTIIHSWNSSELVKKELFDFFLHIPFPQSISWLSSLGLITLTEM